MRIVALFRVSTEKQANEGASLEAQQREYRALAAQHGWATVAEFRGCESATQAATERRVLQQVLACVRETEPDGIYVHEQSRLTRGDELEVALLMRELRERRMKIVVHGVVRDLSSIDERFMVGIQSLVDRAESERIKERMSRGRRERARQGRKTCGPSPYGYENPPPGQPGRGTLRIVPEEAAVVRRIFALAAEGRGDQAIAKALNTSGVAAPRGGRWGKSTIRRVLTNPAYVGTSAANTWVDRGGRSFARDLSNENAIVVENAHEAIVDRQTWDAVHARVPQPRTATPRLLTGLLWSNGHRCGSDWSHDAPYYRGPRGVRGAPWLPSVATDEAVWDAFVSLATEPEMVERLMAEALSPHERQVVEQEIAWLEERVGKQRRRLDNLVEMRADGEITKEVYAAKAADAERAIAEAEGELAGLRARLAAQDGAQAPRVVRAVQTLLAGKSRLTTDQKRRILRAIVRRVDVEAVRQEAAFRRDERGRVMPGKVQRWGIGKVTLRLALPGEGEAASRTEHAEASERTANGRGRAPSRAGQKVTTAFGCGQVSDTESAEGADFRAGHTGTTAFGCRQVSVTVRLP